MTTLLLSLSVVLAQKRLVKGVVTSQADGQPVIGATVVVNENPKIGAVTDFDGRFQFEAPAGAKKLKISYVGYKAKVVTIKNGLIRITLAQDQKALDEVVVTAMGISRERKSLGYASQVVKSEDLTSVRTPDLNNALAGKVSGIRFIGASGATFDAGKIVLRGTSSLDPDGSEPIYVVDGVITNKSMINMDDVASVNVLKGPAATAVYGSEGGNGAIIITSKGGYAGVGGGGAFGDQTLVTFGHTLTVDLPVTHYKYQNQYGGGGLGSDPNNMPVYKWKVGDAAELKALDGVRYYDYGNDVNWGAKFDGEPYIPFYAWDPTSSGYAKTAPWKYAGDDNLNKLFRTGVANTTNVSFTRSSKNQLTRVSFTNLQRKGIVPNSDAMRRFLAIKSSFSPLKNLYLDLDYKYTFHRTHNSAVEGYGGINPIYTFTQWFNTNVNVDDLKDYKRPDGSYRSWNIISRENFTPNFHNNPFALFNEINNTVDYQWNVFSAGLRYDITKKLKAGVTVLGNLRTHRQEFKVAKGLIGEDAVPQYAEVQDRTLDIRTQAKLSYSDRFFKERLTLDAAVYAEERQQTYNELKGYTTDGLTDNVFNLKFSKGKPLSKNYMNQLKTRSLYGTTTLGLDHTYFLDLSARNDWSSTLPEKNNSYFYGGASASIILSELLPKNDVVSFWKIRGSLAQVGSTMSPYNVNQIYLVGKFGSSTTQFNDAVLNNPDIKPTISTSYEVGTELRLLNNRIWADLNFYKRLSKNQILNIAVTPQSGFNERKLNVGTIENRGVEFSVGADIIRTKNWKWDVTANISKNENKLVELADGIDKYRVAYFGFTTKAYLWAEVGRPVGVIRTSTFKYTPDGQQILGERPDGSYKMSLQLGDNEEVGNVQPDATGGFSTSVSYKGLSLRAAFDFQIGGNIISVTNMFGEGSGLLDVTAHTNDKGKNVRDAVKDGGGIPVDGLIYSLDAEGNNLLDANGKPISRTGTAYIDARSYYGLKSLIMGEYVYKASYLKMRELALSYQLPKSLLEKVGFIKSANLSLVASNPFLLYSAVPNLDVSEAVGGSFSGFLEGGQTVSTRSVGFSVNLTF